MDAGIVCKKILIANRAEVALRIQQTCKSLGIKTVAVYAPEDASASFVQEADEAYGLSLRGFQAYLNQEEIIAIACQAGADAIHPGYGFLSENPSFAAKVIQAGILWIGPDSETMVLSGDKAQARALMRMIGIPINAGYEFKPVAFNLDAARECALSIGFPVIIKDALGGGGKAMRLVYKEADFANAWHAVLSEGKRLGFAGSIIVEKYLIDARHIEVQIAGDGENFVHLYERECSVQRRHQKIVEEAPCQFISPQLLEKMYQAALSIAQAVRYKGIGTVEFLVTAEKEFFFLEINARLQVEHAVTELTTGVDLIALQISIATQGFLPFVQQDIPRIGHAIEVRIYAEDPLQNFLPSTGKIEYLKVPRGPFARVDCDLERGYEITPFFDPMIAKIAVWGMGRPAAIANMLGVLGDFVLVGCTTNKKLLESILQSKDFLDGNVSTHWLLSDGVLEALTNSFRHQGVEQDKELTAIAAVVYQALGAKFYAEAGREHSQELQNSRAQGAWRNNRWK